MTDQDPATVVQRFVQAANDHDVDALVTCMHPDFESVQPQRPSRNFVGSEQVRRNWTTIFEHHPDFEVEVRDLAVRDTTVWVELTGRGAGVHTEAVFILTIDDGRVRRARVYSEEVEPADGADDIDAWMEGIYAR